QGAYEGTPINARSVENILNHTKLNVQYGGGIRSMEEIENWLDKGVARIVLGTLSMRKPELVKEACTKFPGKIVVAVDARGDYVAVEGWSETSEVKLLDVALQLESFGAAAIQYTDIDRFGKL